MYIKKSGRKIINKADKLSALLFVFFFSFFNDKHIYLTLKNIQYIVQSSDKTPFRTYKCQTNVSNKENVLHIRMNRGCNIAFNKMCFCFTNVIDGFACFPVLHSSHVHKWIMQLSVVQHRVYFSILFYFCKN